MQAHDPCHHIQLLNNTHYKQYIQRVQKRFNVGRNYSIIYLSRFVVHQVHVFTRLICLFVKQMVLMCLRGRLLLLLRWHNIPIKTISRSCVPNEPSKLILNVETLQWFGLCVYLFGLHKYVTIANCL